MDKAEYHERQRKIQEAALVLRASYLDAFQNDIGTAFCETLVNLFIHKHVPMPPYLIKFIQKMDVERAAEVCELFNSLGLDFDL